MSGRTILTAAEMRSAEQEAIALGTSVETLMDRAGSAAAEAIRRFAGPIPALVLCGPGNNGGDGYVIAHRLRESGVEVRVAAMAEPGSEAALAARARWNGPVENAVEAAPAPLLVDALFGTGLARSLDEALVQALKSLVEASKVGVAIDLPSGIATDDGCLLSSVPNFDLTITFATLKPSHLLQPAARHMGRIVVADIGIVAASMLEEIGRPLLKTPGPDDHKYNRGYVAVIAGEMPGAAALSAAGALRAGAGYVRLLANEHVPAIPNAIVQGAGKVRSLFADSRVGALAIGPGLGNAEAAGDLLAMALESKLPLVLDADALTRMAQLGLASLHVAATTPILTPHAGEFARLFEDSGGSKVDRARRAAAEARSVIVYKGPDTVVAAPDGRAAIASPSNWLATAGTGDVLTGVIAAMRARGMDAFEAACAGVWIHGRSAGLAGKGLIADDLLEHLPAALADCL